MNSSYCAPDDFLVSSPTVPFTGGQFAGGPFFSGIATGATVPTATAVRTNEVDMARGRRSGLCGIRFSVRLRDANETAVTSPGESDVELLLRWHGKR
jgi:hypothetical protein